VEGLAESTADGSDPNAVALDLPPGTRVRIESMPEEPMPIPAGTSGTILSVSEDSHPRYRVQWDDLRRLCLLPGIDRFEIIGSTELVACSFGCPRCENRAMDLLSWDQDGTEVTCDLCGFRYTPET